MSRSEIPGVRRTEARWSDVKAELVHRANLKRQEVAVFAETHSIFLNIKGAARTGESYLDGRRTGFIARPEGSLTYVPPGYTWTGWDEGDAAASYLLISVGKQFAGGLFDTPAPGALRPLLGFRDLSIQFAARKVASELQQGDRVSRLMVEGQIATIFANLLRRSAQSRVTWRGGLAPRSLRLVLDKIESSIDQKLGLVELSNDIGVSVEHLCRAFKRSTGVSPHAYLNGRRLERASDLLRQTDMPITEIAFMCGYSSASHLTYSFRQELGASPMAYRSAWAE